MRDLVKISRDLSSPSLQTDYDPILADLSLHKTNAVRAGDEAEAKRIWCIEHAAEVQQLYHQAYRFLQASQFYDAWRKLEQVELGLNRLRRHDTEHWSSFYLNFIDSKTKAIQGLYPYKIFMSPEFVELQKKCNICERPISIRNPCGHKVGEIYNGEYCFRIVTDFEVVGMAFVESPVQKYSVAFMADPKTGGMVDQYNYSTVKYLYDRWPSPYHDWQVEWTKSLHPKHLFGTLRRNEKCPCDSGKKYKNCCMNLNGIIRPHAVFDFKYPINPSLQRVELSY